MPTLIFYRKEFHVKHIFYLFLLCFGLFFTTSTASAATFYTPEVPENWPEDINYKFRDFEPATDTLLIAVKVKTDTYYGYNKVLISCTNSGAYADYITTGAIRVNNGGDDYCVKAYYREDDKYWQMISYANNIAIEPNDASGMIYSNKTIYVANTEEVFFKPGAEVPLHLVPAEIMKVEQTHLMSTLVGTMGILVRCGVGLIALLVVYLLFFKLSYLFPKR